MFLRTKIAAGLFMSLLIAQPMFAQTRPFPQAGKFEMAGSVIKPSNKTQGVLNSDITTIFTNYKNTYLKTASGGKYYINATGEGEHPCGIDPKTISEAHGYGMIIFALMAGYDSDAKTIFDGMNALRKAQQSKGNAKLMSWVVCDANASSARVDNSATDGDLDNAYALLLAYKQWGDNQYLTDAKELIGAIKASSMHTSALRTSLGDWDWSANNTRTSDWMPGHFRAFYEATGDVFWKNVADNVYTMLGQCSNPSTGLIPDFATGSPAKPDATGGGTGEANAQHYSYNACRDPWRLALDYAHHGTAAAKSQIDKISTWLEGSSGQDPWKIYGGYKLDGTPLNNWGDIVFTAPFASGMISNSANQNFLNKTYTNILDKDMKPNNEYGTAIQILNMLLISGNWWAPYSSKSDTGGVVIKCDTVNIVGWDAGSWGSDVDPVGSSVDFTATGSQVDFTFNRAAEDEANEIYTWASVYCGFNKGDFSNVSSISITYTSDKPISIVLGDPTLTDKGEGYMYVLGSGTNKSVTIPINDFTQPEWADYSFNDLSKVASIVIQAENIGKTTGKISKLELNGFGDCSTPIVPKPNVRKSQIRTNISITNGNLSFNIPSEKVLLVNICDIRGRLLLSKEVTLNSGIASIALPTTLMANQTLILNVQGRNGLKMSKKMLAK